MAYLAATYQYSGRWKEAQELDGQSHLTSTYQKQGQWKRAEELEVQLMESTKAPDLDHPHTLISIANLVSIYRNKTLGQKHPDTLSSMGNLASTYQHQGQWKEVEELQVQVMEFRKRALGQQCYGREMQATERRVIYKSNHTEFLRPGESVDLLAQWFKPLG
ncbi:MAG: hypothetical protein M1816_003305 [Peltula sp. TS41687]|nr:MAG: hypothetical protein M1816_003305 [Peltula sp. TS41687]